MKFDIYGTVDVRNLVNVDIHCRMFKVPFFCLDSISLGNQLFHSYASFDGKVSLGYVINLRNGLII